MIKIILLGPPGVGKGTQAELLCRELSIKHISTGELLRQAVNSNTTLGLQVKEIIDSGQLVSNEIIINLVVDQITGKFSENGFLLDGFPRNIEQAKSLQQAGVDVDFIISLQVDDHTLIERLSGRRYHSASGRIYHVKYNPPKIEGLDDLTGEPLIIRPDDHKDVISQRLSVYHQSTEGIINWYKNLEPDKFIAIDAHGEPSKIFKEIKDFIYAKERLKN